MCLNVKKSKKIKGQALPPAPPAPNSRPGVRLRSAHDVMRLLARTTNRLLRGEMDIQTAGKVGYLCGLMLGGFETVVLEDRIQHLEQLQAERDRKAQEEESGSHPGRSYGFDAERDATHEEGTATAH